MVPASAIRRIATIAVLTTVACGEHVPAGPGPGDYLPPSVIAVAAVDVSHVRVVFDEPVTRWSADNPAHYQIAVSDGPSPGLVSIAAVSVMDVLTASLHDDSRTVTLTTTNMEDAPYLITVTGVADTHGNAIIKNANRLFYGTKISDITPPEVVIRLPQPDATGIATGLFVTVGFSEAVKADTMFRGLRVRGEGARLATIRYEDLLHYTCEVDSLEPDTRYTVTLRGVQDLAGNTMPDVEWVFDTQTSYDTTAPSVVSSWPEHGDVNVDVTTDLSLTFSEPMDPYSVILRPPVTAGALQWSNGGRTLRYETQWLSGRQYTVQIRPGEMRDQAGNASRELFTLTFSTGEVLETGSFAGTITGDPHSTRAEDPSGGLVFAGPTSPDDIYTSVVGIVSALDGYELTHLPNRTYFPFYLKDTNGDGMYQPMYGDAVGVFGISDWFSDDEPRSVTVNDARVSGIDFRIYDPISVYGHVGYDGLKVGLIRVGLFRTDGFDPMTSVPVLAIASEWTGRGDYVINSLDTGPVLDGEYYVAAFLDCDGNGILDPSCDPIGVYGGATPIAIDLSRGNDAPGIDIELFEPSAVANTAAVRWPASPRSLRLDRVMAWLAAVEGKNVK